MTSLAYLDVLALIQVFPLQNHVRYRFLHNANINTVAETALSEKPNTDRAPAQSQADNRTSCAETPKKYKSCFCQRGYLDPDIVHKYPHAAKEREESHMALLGIQLFPASLANLKRQRQAVERSQTDGALQLSYPVASTATCT
eukprot:GFKZ01012799.1.p1 GENE.GFKZ01012799.1~~GFKZ01012799.1.p1  ORF type:complete len:143 (-),score=11.57 GFKZ01012799.1:442-870(-)